MFLITRAMRDAAWDWTGPRAEQPHDQHVRDRLKADDAAVLGQIIGYETQRRYEADAIAAGRIPYA
jgi:curli biogenesis system outer membrane secretion channel CsgG